MRTGSSDSSVPSAYRPLGPSGSTDAPRTTRRRNTVADSALEIGETGNRTRVRRIDLERAARGIDAPDGPVARLYRAWYVSPDDIVVANGTVAGSAAEGATSNRPLGANGGPVVIAVGTSYPELLSALAFRIGLTGVTGTVLVVVGIGLVAPSLA